MSMGRRQKLADGDEYDVVSKWRHLLAWTQRAGKKRGVKKTMNKRARKEAKADLRDYRE